MKGTLYPGGHTALAEGCGQEVPMKGTMYP